VTIIAAAVDSTGGYLASDSGVSCGGLIYPAGSKVFRLCPRVAVGFSGSCLLGTLHGTGELDTITRETVARDSEVASSYLGIGRWWQRVHALVRGLETSTLDASGARNLPADGLAVTTDGIYVLSCDGSVIPVDGRSWAIGSGAEVGVGAMYAARRCGACARVDVAVEAACRYAVGCVGPAHVVRVGG